MKKSSKKTIKTEKTENPISPKLEAESNDQPKAQPKTQSKPPKTPSKFGVLGKDLSSKFSARGDRSWRHTKRGGRNGQGKP